MDSQHSAHDLYNALMTEFNGMVASFVRDYGWNPITDDYLWNALLDYQGDMGTAWEDMNARVTEITARNKALMLADGSESERVFNDMHNEYLDDMARV